MPFQSSPFNADTFIQDEFLILLDKYNIKTVIETGTCLGYTTLWLAQHFEKVYTIELNKEYCEIARSKFLLHPNITSIHGNSADVLRHLRIEGNAMLFADAHWNNNCPLLGELHAIHQLGIKPCVVIHDFKTNDDRFGYDSYKGQPFTFEWVKHSLDKIYGKDNFNYYFNTGLCEQSAKRGVIYITPKI